MRDAFPPIRNRLLRSIPRAQLAPFEAALRPEPLLKGQLVYDGGSAVDEVYFIETGIVSLTTNVGDGVWVEVGMAGREGMVGWSALLTPAPIAMHRAVVLLPGEALVARTRDFRAMIERLPALRSACLRYVNVLMTQISQTAACNGHHQLRERIARWLLMSRDRIDGDEISIIQESMSSVFGVRRPSISDSVASLHLAGLVQQSRGRLTILNRAGLKASACSCYGIIRSAEARLKGK